MHCSISNAPTHCTSCKSKMYIFASVIPRLYFWILPPGIIDESLIYPVQIQFWPFNNTINDAKCLISNIPLTGFCFSDTWCGIIICWWSIIIQERLTTNTGWSISVVCIICIYECIKLKHSLWITNFKIKYKNLKQAYFADI